MRKLILPSILVLCVLGVLVVAQAQEAMMKPPKVLTMTREVLAWLPCCLPPTRNGVGMPDLRAFRSSITPPTDASIYASRNTSRCPLQDSRPGWIRYFLPVGLLHPLQHAGLARRTPSCS